MRLATRYGGIWRVLSKKITEGCSVKEYPSIVSCQIVLLIQY